MKDFRILYVHVSMCGGDVCLCDRQGSGVCTQDQSNIPEIIWWSLGLARLSQLAEHYTHASAVE